MTNSDFCRSIIYGGDVNFTVWSTIMDKREDVIELNTWIWIQAMQYLPGIEDAVTLTPSLETVNFELRKPLPIVWSSIPFKVDFAGEIFLNRFKAIN